MSEKPQGLWVTDGELIRRSGVPEKTMRARLKFFDADPKATFPKKSETFGNRRYWPVVQQWMEGHDVTEKPVKTPGRKMSEAVGRVYFLASERHVKIGFTSTSIKRRIKEIRRGHPELMELLTVVTDASTAVERHLQRKFAAHKCPRLRDWFYRVPEIEEFARTHQLNHWRKELAGQE